MLQKKALLFDFDNTLANTAADLSRPIEIMRSKRGLPVLPDSLLQKFAPKGAKALIKNGLGVTEDSLEFPALLQEFLSLYEKTLVSNTHLFPGIESLLAWLDKEGIVWGIVSNKVERFLKLIVQHLGLYTKAACVVGGDTTSFSKPHPEPLIHAAKLIGYPQELCIYAGDDYSDIIAGKAAGMKTIAVLYEYSGLDDDPVSWGSDALVYTPQGFIKILQEMCAISV